MTVEITGLRELQADLRRLSTRDMKRAVYGTLDAVAEDANARLAKRFQRDIEGGPARFSEIRPGQRNGAVVANRARADGDGVASSIRVQSRQARYLAFQLGDETIRKPGVVGAASKFNFLFVGTAHQGRTLGIRPDAHGNLPRNALKKLVRDARSQREQDAEGVKKRKLEATKANLRAERERRRRRQERMGGGKAWGKKTVAQRQEAMARISRTTFLGQASTTGIFFGRLRAGSRSVGFWQRPPERSQKPTLLVLGVPRSNYRNPRLTQGWNESVEQAMAEMPKTMQGRIADALAGRLG